MESQAQNAFEVSAEARNAKRERGWLRLEGREYVVQDGDCLNIRFNPNHTGDALAAWIEEEAQAAVAGFQGTATVVPQTSGEAFLTAPGPFTELVAAAVRDATGADPELSTSGGTSDARFIRALCPVVELGLVGKTMHSVDERAPLAEIRQLQAVYERLIARYFEAFG